MGAFSSDGELDWRRIDVLGIVSHAGIATVRNADVEACVNWLASERYHIAHLNCATGFRELRRQLGVLFSWSAQFGYELEDDGETPPNLDALRDGFGFTEVQQERRVLCVEGLECLWAGDAEWAAAFLSIASEYSRVQLAVGRRFFTLLALSNNSPLLGAVFHTVQVPFYGWRDGNDSSRVG